MLKVVGFSLKKSCLKRTGEKTKKLGERGKKQRNSILLITVAFCMSWELLDQKPDTGFSWMGPEVVWSTDHIPGIWRAASAGRIGYRVTERWGPITWKSLPAWNGLQIPAFWLVFQMTGSWPVCGQSPKQQKDVRGSRGIQHPARDPQSQKTGLVALH